MARQVGPDQSERVFFYTSGSKKGQVIPAGTPVPLFADNQCTLPADVLSLDGSAIAGTIPTVLTGDTLEVPLFQFPDVTDPTVYTRILGGPVVALHPRVDDRIDALTTRVTGLEAGGSGDALLVHKAGAETIAGIKTFSASPLVPTPTTSGQAANKAYVDTGLSDASAAAASAAASAASAASAAASAATAGQRTIIAAFSPLKRAMNAAGTSAAVQLLGDSTGNDGNEWFANLAGTLATSYPGWTVQRRLWDDATQAFAAPVTVSTGTAGERYMDCTTGTRTRELPAAVSPALSGVIDIRIKVQMADWTPAVQANFLGKSGAGGARGFYLAVNTTGLLMFVYSTDGTALTTVFATTTNGIADGTTSWVRAVFTPDDGAGNKTTSFYKSTDGVTWTQIGTTVTSAGTVTIFNNSTQGYELGGTVSGISAAQPKIYEAFISAGGSSPSVVPALPEHWPRGSALSPVIVGAPVLTFVNGSMPGQGISYLGDATRLPKMTPNFGQVLTFLSTSHNETNAVGKQWVDRYATFVGQVRAQLPGAPVIAVSQNPERSGTTWYQEHNGRQLTLDAYTRAERMAMLDVYNAFLANPSWATDYMNDDVHPNPAGSTVWSNLAKSHFDAAV